MTAPRGWRWCVAGVFAGALAWRLAALWRLAHGPLLRLVRDDCRIYWDWAGEIRSGHWIPARAFFFGPLYPYVLAAVRTLVGDHLIGVLVFQCVLGALAVALITDACRRVASPLAATIAGVFLAGYSMSVFFDAMILSEGLLFFLGSLVIWLTVRDAVRFAPAIGAIVALMALGRGIFLLLLIPFGVLIWRSRPARPLRVLAITLVTPIVVLLVTGAHHRRVIGAFIPLTYSSGFNLYVGNGPGATGTFTPFHDWNGTETGSNGAPGGEAAWDGRLYLERTRGLRLDPAQSSRYWTELTLANVRADPLSAARLLLGKLALLFNHRELPQIVDTRTYDLAGGPLGWPLDWEFALLAIAGLAGIPASWRRGPAPRALVGYLGALVIGTALFFVVDRYRIHLVPILAVLGAIGIADLTAGGGRPRSWHRVAAGLLAAGAGVLTFAPLIGASPGTDEWNAASTLGEAWLVDGEPERALPLLDRAAELDREGALALADARVVRLARASAYENLGLAASAIGDDPKALAGFSIASELMPESQESRLRLAEQLVISGDPARARREFQAAGLSEPQAAQQLLAEAAQQDHAGRAANTRKLLEAAVVLDPRNEAVTVALVRSRIVSDDLDAARTLLRAGAASGLDPNLVRAHEAWICERSGDTAAARRFIEAIPESARVFDPRVAGTLALAATRRPLAPDSHLQTARP